MRRRLLLFLLGWILLSVTTFPAAAEERFPPPEFTTTGHTLPTPTRPPPRDSWWTAADVLVLGALLGLAAWLIHRRRSRTGIYTVMAVAVAYFGFWREGCVCPIGGLQNLAQAAADPQWVLPIGVLAIVGLPLVATLLFGRVYCGAVCPHGALQDALCFRPVQLPRWLQEVLGLAAWIYLGFALLFAATGAAYIICEYDPFIALFRLAGSLPMLLFGGVFLLLSVFIGRPYCRFLCPYGAILRLLSTLSWRQVQIFPDRCIDCRLCDHSCPYGAIRPITPAAESQARPRARRNLALALLATPLLMVALGWGLSRLADRFARLHPAVLRAEAEAAGEPATPPHTAAELLLHDRRAAAREQVRDPADLAAAAQAVRDQFAWGTWILGAGLGLTIGLKLAALARPERRTDYQADRATCVACARCFDYCPGEKGLLDPAIAARARRV